MLKILGTPAVTFGEFPDEIALCLNISNCPGMCPHCSEPELLKDVGTPLTDEYLTDIINQNPGITMIGFMGGDRDVDEVIRLATYIHRTTKLKVGMYSGQEFLDIGLLGVLEYYKIGKWIFPEGDSDNWWKRNCGPLKFTFSNQLMFKRNGRMWENITYKFREKPINNLQKEIL